VIHRESRETYGSPSIWDALVKQGHRIGEHRVARLMRQDGIRAKTVKKWRPTAQSQHRFPVAANTLNRQFTVESPNRVWAGDLTYVWTTEGWLYLAVILDLYSRLVIGWAMGPPVSGKMSCGFSLNLGARDERVPWKCVRNIHKHLKRPL